MNSTSAVMKVNLSIIAKPAMNLWVAIFANLITPKNTIAKKGKLMSANVYSIENLLVGKIYRSKTMVGEIVSAKKDERAIWYGEDLEPYLVEIQPNSGYNNFGHRTFRTIAVNVGG